MIDRRAFLAGASALAAGCRPLAATKGEAIALQDRFEAIRATLGAGGGLGVAAIETGSGRWLLHDADGRYAMASTFKLPLAAMILTESERKRLSLAEELPFGPGDLLDNSPVIEANLAVGRLSIVRLCGAIVERSDNSAANLLLRRIGGPEALTRFLRRLGDQVTRLDRYEMALNSNLPGDPRDTTSPRAMAELARIFLAGEQLSRASRNLLSGWMTRSVPGRDRLLAGLPVEWVFGHKTGTGANGAVNDVGVAWRPAGRAPIVIASYQSGGKADAAVRAAAHAAVARLVAGHFG